MGKGVGYSIWGQEGFLWVVRAVWRVCEAGKGGWEGGFLGV